MVLDAVVHNAKESIRRISFVILQNLLRYDHNLSVRQCKAIQVSGIILKLWNCVLYTHLTVKFVSI